MTVVDWCNQIQNDFLDHHKREAQLQPLTDVHHVITCLNGTLQLWKKQSDNRLIITDSADTPALQTEYKLCKSFPHISVMIDRVLRSICMTGFKNKQHESDLLKIDERLLQLNRLDERCVDNHRAVIALLLAVVHEAKLSASLEQIQHLLAKHLEKTTLIHEHYAKQAAELQLQGMHRIVLSWMKKIDVCKTRVLIAVAAGPKNELIEGQYFHSFYIKQGIMNPLNNQHLIYIEMLPRQLSIIDSQCLIDVLKEKMLNRAIADVMLGNPEAMNQDVLGQFAPHALQRLCPYDRKVKTSISAQDHFDTSQDDITPVTDTIMNTIVENKKTYPLKTGWDARFFKTPHLNLLPHAAREEIEKRTSTTPDYCSMRVNRSPAK